MIFVNDLPWRHWEMKLKLWSGFFLRHFTSEAQGNNHRAKSTDQPLGCLFTPVWLLVVSTSFPCLLSNPCWELIKWAIPTWMFCPVLTLIDATLTKYFCVSFYKKTTWEFLRFACTQKWLFRENKTSVVLQFNFKEWNGLVLSCFPSQDGFTLTSLWAGKLSVICLRNFSTS